MRSGRGAVLMGRYRDENQKKAKAQKRRKNKKKKKQTKASPSGAGSSSVPPDDSLLDVVDQLKAVDLGESGDDNSAPDDRSNLEPIPDTKGKGKQVHIGNDLGQSLKTASPRSQKQPTHTGNQPNHDDPKNPLIKLYNLETGLLEEHRVARAYGNQDMYRDLDASDANHVEKKLAVLEQAASQVVRRIKEAQKAGTMTIDLVRADLNCLRKFLFVMKYRNSLLWKKYSISMEEYDAIDKPQLQLFMKSCGFTKPAQVWLHTLKTILDTPIDARGDWKRVLLGKAFEPDALWFFLHMTESYLALCQPDHPDDEFVITENGFGINEGPTSETVALDPETGVATSKYGAYTEYHKIAPLSPRLLLVLRSNFLRKGNEHLLREIRAGPAVANTPSLFEDLELTPAVPCYVVQAAETFEAKDEHVFTFKIQKISREYTDLFNAMMFEEARDSITWASDKATQRSLKTFLEHPKFQHPSSYLTHKREAKSRLLGLLEGSEPKIPARPPGNPFERVAEEFATKPELRVYFKLGGKPSTVMFDIRRASELSHQRRESADRAPQGPQHVEARNAGLRREMLEFSQQPSPVIYLHIKMWRANANVAREKLTGQAPQVDDKLADLLGPGPEDLVGNLASIIDEKHRSRLMLEASMKVFFRDIHRRRITQLRMGKEQSASLMVQNERALFAQWGGIKTSYFLENSEFYSDIGKKIMDPRRSKKTDADMDDLFSDDLIQRIQLKMVGFIEAVFLTANNSSEERQWLNELLWDALYWWPEGVMPLLDEMGKNCAVM
ncbi:hypothetical protein FN846DRAFT_962127 [Sphaerosporella brunnea]|uniref:Uncharacterized protein n=1 Tax=Sphaerosporella brunnea TaxID=1250544 RepID=A0A5J5EPK7_9PEZI|nr:hypothetical protein FN846DRAFT_962127 [Sphaerosporella brunnea]